MILSGLDQSVVDPSDHALTQNFGQTRVRVLERFALDPDFSQRFTRHFSQDNDSIVGEWEMSRDGGSSWSTDFSLTYARME